MVAGDLHDENQYLRLIGDILDNGEMVTGRNGDTKAVFGAAMHFDLKHGVIPLLTTKRVAVKTCFKELLWFIKGCTDNKKLKAEGVHIWDDNGSREFLDSRGLTNLEEDDLGPVYGHQWRHFNASYGTCDSDYGGQGVDQLAYVIDCLKDPAKRSSRRILMSAWNPCQIDEMALPPCHVMCQFNVIGNQLSCSLYQRSGDVGLGVPFNIASYSMLTHLLAHHCGLEANEFVYYLGNAHIYDDHIAPLQLQMARTPYKFPTVEVVRKLDDIEEYTIDDFVIRDYTCHPKVVMQMRQ